MFNWAMMYVGVVMICAPFILPLFRKTKRGKLMEAGTVTLQLGRYMTVPGNRPLAWQDESACGPVYASTGDDLWFEPDEEDGEVNRGRAAARTRADRREKAKRVCRECPVRMECLTFAYANNEPAGIWGGLDKRERVALKKKVKADNRAVA